MKNTGKITVKHFLNTRVKPISISKGGENTYPIYVQMTIARQTTHVRSFSNAIMTETEFEEYQKGNNINNFLTPKEEFFLLNELERIEKSLLYMRERHVSFSGWSEVLRSWVEFLLKPVEYGLIEGSWTYIENNGIETDQEYRKRVKFYKCFNKDVTLIESITLLKHNFKVDISEGIPKNDYIFWQNIQLLIKSLDANMALIDFLDSDCDNYIRTIKAIKDKETFVIDFNNMLVYLMV